VAQPRCFAREVLTETPDRRAERIEASLGGPLLLLLRFVVCKRKKSQIISIYFLDKRKNFMAFSSKKLQPTYYIISA
jgi:hypothetical protein